MTRRFLLAMTVAVGLVGCGGGGADNEQAKDTTDIHDVVITRNPDGTFSFKSEDKSMSNISSVQVTDQEKSDVKAFFEESLAADSGGRLCCDSCSLSGGVLICTGCRAC